LAQRAKRARIGRLKKRFVALAFLATVVALVVATLLALRTAWAGDRVCALAAERARAALGLPLSFTACRFEPLAMEVRVEGVRLGPPEAPVFAADAVGARLALVQALGGRVRLVRLELVKPRLHAAVPRGTGGGVACGPELLNRVEVRELRVDEGSLDLALPDGVRIAAGRIDLQAQLGTRSLRNFSLRPRTRVELALADVRVDGVDDRPFTSPRLTVAGDVAMDLSGAELRSFGGVVDGVTVSGRGKVKDLCAPVVDVAATATGPFREVLALIRAYPDADAEGKLTLEAKVQGPIARPAIGGTVRAERARVGWFKAGAFHGQVRLAPDFEALLVDAVEWPLPGALVRVGKAKVGWGRLRERDRTRTVTLEAEVDTGGADLNDVLDSVGVDRAWVTVRLDGKGRVAGTLWPDLALAAGASGEFRDLRVYTSFAKAVRPGTEPVVEFRRGRFDVPFEIREQGITWSGARLAYGRGSATVDAVTRFSVAGGFEARGTGTLDLDLLGKIAGVPVGGLADFDGRLGAAPYGNPHAVAIVRAEGFRFLDVALGTGTAELDYGPDTNLRVRDAEGTYKRTEWRGDGVADLGTTPVQVRRMRLEAGGPVRDLVDAVQDWLPKVRPFRNTLDGDVEAEVTASGPATALEATFDAKMAHGTFYGRPFDSARTIGTVHEGREARFRRAELHQGAGAVRMTGRYGFAAPFPWDLDVAVAGLSLGDAGLPGGAAWSGSASGTAALRGSFEHPDIRFAANGDGVAVRGIALGSLQAAGTVLERDLVVTGGGEGLAFEGKARLEGKVPFQARADVTLDDVARLVPGGAASSVRAKVKGEATAEGELAALDLVRARVRLDDVQVAHAEFKVRATEPAVLTASRGRIELEPLTLVGPNTELRVSGARIPSGQLDLSAQGTADLRLLGGLIPDLRRPHGQLAVEAHLTGTFEDPVLVGAGRLSDAGFQLKTTSVLFSDIAGALAFSQNRILFEELSATVNGGRTRLKGEVELANLTPSRLRVEAQLDEIPLSVPGTLSAALSGRAEAAGTPEATTVTGRLHVVRARYTADLGLERNLMKVGVGRGPPPPAKPYDKSGEWLRFDLQVVVDGDVRVENDVASGLVHGELTVTGTLAAPGVVGSLSMAEGSRARFRGNEFVLSHAVLEFTDRNRVEMSMDVHGQSQVRDYQIFMHAFGPLADPRLDLTSTPFLTKPDIITLLSLGYTRRDTGAGVGVQGAAAAAAGQALLSASGLDDQVRRFVPRSPLVRDFALRITSDWSESSGQVEPKAELESYLLDNKLRLRYQAPLSGSRGQKAQAEVKLGKNAAVQYQWDNDNPDVATGDHGVDLKLRWEWTD
jgi:translocation and assembly module TamB